MERQALAKVQKSPPPSNHVQRQSGGPTSAVNPLLDLQRSIGIQAVQRLIQSPYIQTKLKISTPGDASEQEADRVADTVMRMPEPSNNAGVTEVQAKPIASQITPLLQREAEQSVEEEKEEQVAPKLESSQSAIASLVQREAEQPVEEEKEEQVAPKLDAGQPAIAPLVQREAEQPVEEEKEEQVAPKLDAGHPAIAPMVQCEAEQPAEEEKEERVAPKLDASQPATAPVVQREAEQPVEEEKEETVARKLDLQRVPLAVREDEEEEKVAPKLETDPSAIAPLLQREAESPVKEEKEKVVTRKADFQRVPLAVREDEEEEKVSPKPEVNLAPQDEKEKTLQMESGTEALLQRQLRDDDKKDESAASAPPVQRQMQDEEEEEVQTKPHLLSRLPVIPSRSGPAHLSVQRLCKECTGDEHGPVVHCATAATAPAVGRNTSLAANIHALNGGGSPLPTSVRAFFEPRFGADFGHVRVYTDARAAETARSLNAKAFAVGRDIAFAGGQYSPQSHEGRRLLAHELTHTLQQGTGVTRDFSSALGTHAKNESMVQRDVSTPAQSAMRSVAVRSSARAIHRVCTECDEEKKEKQAGAQVQRQSAESQVHDDDETDQGVQPKSAQASTPKVTNSVAANVHALNGRGSPLPQTTRAFFEPRFGADFGQVRVHTDSTAAETAKAINARAFTVGQNIAFGSGQYAPESQGGKQVLAHELTHVLQQRGAGATNNHAVSRTEEQIQTFPKAGDIYPSTDKQRLYYGHRDEVVDIQGMGMFKPGSGLGNYIASLWREGQDAPVNIKFGSLGSGFIFVKPAGSYRVGTCITVPTGLFTPDITICKDTPPESTSYNAGLQSIPIEHEAFEKSDKGSLVLLVGIISGVIWGKLAWMEGKKIDEIDPYAFQRAYTSFDESAFLPLIYGDQYDGKNYTSAQYDNRLDNGVLSFLSSGQLEVANQQKIEGKLGLVNKFDIWLGNLKGKAIGLEEYEIPIERNSKAELHGDSTGIVLDKQWSSGDQNSEDGVFTQGEIRASYKNGTFDFFGKATYASARINGEVNIAVTSESEAQQLFAEHAPAEQVQKAKASVPTNPDESSKEPLAATAWGNLSFKVFDKKATTAATPAATKGKKFIPEDLHGEGAFAVSPEGYIILSGKLKLPAKWQFTEKQDYRSDDPDNDAKHLFQKEITAARAPAPFGTIGLDLGITVDAYAHLDPLELYEVEISGVYSNHPDYRSEVGITPRFYISGYAGATVTVSIDGAYKLGGVFTLGSVSGEIKGTAQADAYVDAAPTINRIWDGSDTPPKYAIAGTIHSGGKLTFKLTGSLSVRVLRAKIWKTEDYHIGTWTIGSFGLVLNLNEYVLGSGDKPKLDYSKIGFGVKQRQNLGNAIAKEKESAGGDEKRSGGFKQIEEGKEVEKGTFSETPPTRKDLGAEAIANTLEEDFLMQDRQHELLLTFSGTRAAPKALIEMASNGKKPLDEKIVNEEFLLGLEKDFSDDERQEEIEQQERDLKGIETEAKSVKKNAEEAAQKVQGEEEPVVAGFDKLDDRITSYGKKYKTNDLGLETAQPTVKPTPVTPPRVVKKSGASSEMERRLAERRTEVGYESFDNFRRSNVAIFRYYVLKPGAKAIDKSAEGPFYEAAVNVARELHSEVIIAGRLQEIHKSKEFRKKYGPDYIIAVDQILSERSPCGGCRGALSQKSSLIITSNYHTYYLVHYSGDWIERNRSLMLKYGLTPPPLADLKKQYGRDDKDPH